jgi:CDP-diglyceride synthetase
MFDLKDDRSTLFRIVIPIMQVLILISLLLGLAFNNILENFSDILRLISLILMYFISIILGIKELTIKKNKILAFIYLGTPFIAFIYIFYLNIKY